MEDKRDEIRQLIEDTKSLPTLPTVITKLNALVARKNSTNQEIARVISSDQILSAKVLRLVNSPFYGFSRRVSTVSNALILLGVNVIKSLILSTSIFEMMEKNLVGLWEHSMATAVASNVIATRMNLPDKEEVSTAGLLHDIGKIVIRIYLNNDVDRIAALAEEKGIPTYEAERLILGTDHSEVGKWLSESWLLPEKLIEPIACHHDVAKSVNHRHHTAIVHFANILVEARGMGHGGAAGVPSIQDAAKEALKLSNDDLEAIIANLEDKLVEVRNFSMDIQDT